ncbi:steroid receptor RNA activator 1 [Leuresthes tenuis]|uniref:steroid receptor RNA activator 1 n=1 Tax=Leuresthes tenuis TaxID=355514 RepID=UPI003B50068D
MEDMYVKPGNKERGWNDPPQFSYGLQMARGPQKNLLNKRAAPPTDSGTETPGAGAPPSAPSSSNPLHPPPCGIAPPPLLPARCPPAGVAPPPLQVREADGSQSEPDVEAVMSVLNRALHACRKSAKTQVCNDVAKRLRLLEDSWRAERLSLPVRRRMDTLSQELQSGRWDSADDIHRSLMVDHVTEVSQWMVGVKRLIAETRSLSLELLEPLQNLKGPVQDSVEPVQDSSEPVQDSSEPVQDSSEPVQDPAEPVQEPVEPVQDPAEPVQDSSEPVQDSAEPVQDPAEPVQDSAEPVQDPAEPVQEPVEPVQDSAEPVQDSSEPVQDSAEPVQDPAEPVQDSAEPVQDPAGPVQDPSEPVQEPVEPALDPASQP